MPEQVAIYGGSFNPPCRHHREIAELLARQFDRVIVVPCGPRPDKPSIFDVPAVYRAIMVDMNFSGLANVTVDLFDLEQEEFSPIWRLNERYADEGSLWHVIGADWIKGGATGASHIQQSWERGQQVWQELRFAVIERPQHDVSHDDLPPHSKLLCFENDVLSAHVRDRVFHHESFADLVTDNVQRYIERHGLYRGMQPARRCMLRLDELRPLIITDPWNEPAQALAAELGPSEEETPNLIVVVGGDGTMLRAIRREWRRRIPFFGVNSGHLGFLLNHRSPSSCLGCDMVVQQLPLLRVQAESHAETLPPALAFNDTWVERATGQTAWLQVLVNGTTRLDRLVADGALIATPAGSTAYARAMGAAPIPISSPVLILVGSNVLLPPFFRPVVLPLDSTIELRTLDPHKRPLSGYIDGVSHGEVTALKVSTSNVAAVELVFDPAYDPTEKLAAIQFPYYRTEPEV